MERTIAIDAEMFLRKVQEEAGTISYGDLVRSSDKVLMLFDNARRALSPVAERAVSPERNTEVMAVMNEAICALAMSIHGKTEMTDSDAYDALSKFGKTVIPQDRLYWLLDKAIKDLKVAKRETASA